MFFFYESFKEPKNVAHSLSEEKINLLYSQMSAMIEKFEKTDIQALRKICRLPDSRFCRASRNGIFTQPKIPNIISELTAINENHSDT